MKIWERLSVSFGAILECSLLMFCLSLRRFFFFSSAPLSPFLFFFCFVRIQPWLIPCGFRLRVLFQHLIFLHPELVKLSPPRLALCIFVVAAHPPMVVIAFRAPDSPSFSIPCSFPTFLSFYEHEYGLCCRSAYL